MKTTYRILALLLSVVVFSSVFALTAFAREFAPKFDTDFSVNTQYLYEEHNPSWLRQLVVKENMMSVEGMMNEKPIHPITDYPYITDAPCFAKEVNEYVTLYTLDKEAQKAAYIYVFQQLGALSIIADPEATDKSKAEWLRENGIIITKEDEEDPDAILMTSALYALMKNDFYYVLTGNRITIPAGTKLEAALMMYLVALDGDDNSLLLFIEKHFNISSIISLDDYVYYTCLMALYLNGYVPSREIPTISEDEVYRRLAIMSITQAGLSVDANSATTEEIQVKYMAAMLGQQYDVTLDPDSVFRANRQNTVPYYIIQRMAYEDASLTISSAKYTYEQAFDILLKRTNRFDLEKEFYSDIYEYDVHLDFLRDGIYINPVPIDTANLTVTINDTRLVVNKYTKILLTEEPLQALTVKVQYGGGAKEASTYKLNIYQGERPPTVEDEENLTGIISNIGQDNMVNTNSPSYALLDPTISIPNAVVPNANPQVLHINEQGQLVDSQGNVISDDVPDTLPDGFGYILNPNGVVSIGKLDEVTTSSGEMTGTTIDKDQIKTIIIYFSAFLLILLSAIGVAYYRMTVKKRRTKSINRANRTSKKEKETKKKLKKQQKDEKKNSKKNK